MSEIDESEKRYDVVIYELATSKVDSVVGAGMRLDSGHNNAEKRLETAFSRVNQCYSARIVDAGKYDVGDILPAE